MDTIASNQQQIAATPAMSISLHASGSDR